MISQNTVPYIAFLTTLLHLTHAKTDLSGCTSTDVSSPAGASVAWYVPGTGEICAFLDCGGGRAPPKTDVPGCPQYVGTATYSPSYLAGFVATSTAMPGSATTAPVTSEPIEIQGTASSTAASVTITPVTGEPLEIQGTVSSTTTPVTSQRHTVISTLSSTTTPVISEPIETETPSTSSGSMSVVGNAPVGISSTVSVVGSAPVGISSTVKPPSTMRSSASATVSTVSVQVSTGGAASVKVGGTMRLFAMFGAVLGM